MAIRNAPAALLEHDEPPQQISPFASFLNRFSLPPISIPVCLLAISMGLSLVGCGHSIRIPPSETLVMPTGTITLVNDVYMAELSPDGQRLVYDRSTKDEMASHIWISNADGTNPRQITNSSSADVCPSWSPDSKRILFVRASRHRPYSMGGMTWDNMDLWTVGVDGNDEIRVTANNFYQAGSPHFSPDQRHVVFCAYGRASTDAPGGLHLTEEVCIGDFDQNGRVNVMRWMPAAAGPGGGAYFAAANGDPSFSPDGSTIAFISNRVGSASPYDYEVWTTDMAFDRFVQLTHLHTRLNSPIFTLDGQYILFTGDLTREGKTPLWRMKPDGSDIKRVR